MKIHTENLDQVLEEIKFPWVFPLDTVGKKNTHERF